MSCQQVSRLITTTATTNKNLNRIATPPVTPEDPYVFTETVPTTPPILYNNSQKSRSRFTESTTNIKLPNTNFNVETKTQASLASITNVAHTNYSSHNSNKNFNNSYTVVQSTGKSFNSKNATQSQHQKHQQQQQPQKRISNNICIVRPQQQQPPHHHHQHHNQTPTPTTTPPPLLQHTPSLWQTPLLLDTSAVAVAAAALVSPPTSPASLPSSPTPPLAVLAANTTSTVAMVAPLATLPPSNFHHTTLAQHLEKVECLKKPLKTLKLASTDAYAAVNNHKIKPQQMSPPPLQAFSKATAAATTTASPHSDADLIDIPVNVIFRKPHLSGNKTEEDVKYRVPLATQNAASCVLSSSTSQMVSKLKNVRVIAPTPRSDTSSATAPSAAVSKLPKDVIFVQPQVKCDASTINASVSWPLQQQNEMSSNATAARNCSLKMSYSKVNSLPANNKRTNSLASNPPKIVAASSKQVTTVRSNSSPLSNVLHKAENVANITTHAVAVLKLNSAELDLESHYDHKSSFIYPYCTQRHWFSLCSEMMENIPDLLTHMSREERIVERKNNLRRQALQLLGSQTLQRTPLKASRRRLVAVDRLLQKYQQQRREPPLAAKQCEIPSCNNLVLELASHCLEHIIHNATQHMFLPCTAVNEDNTQCRKAVFDVTQDIPLCIKHVHKGIQLAPKINNNFNMSATIMPMEQKHTEIILHTGAKDQYYNKPSISLTAVNQAGRKRKPGVNPVGRPQKKSKKMQQHNNSLASKQTHQLSSPPPLSAVLKRKSSTTSLESIASNSHSSTTSTTTVHLPTALAPPALAPLSNHGQRQTAATHLNFNASNKTVMKDLDLVSFACDNNQTQRFSSQLFSLCGNQQKSNPNFNINNQQNQNVILSSHLLNSNSNSNFTSAFGSSSSLPSATDDFLTQDMLSICENSSAYASSEDTGLGGGISETELMTNANDTDDIPFVDTLEEQDLANVLSSLPDDAFNELFTAVHQDECDEVERALELADKHLKSLQQTIGSESDFLGDFLDVNDDILADDDICSSIDMDSAHLDGSSIFLEHGSSSGMESVLNNGNSNSAVVAAMNSDLRGGLVLRT